MIKKMIKAFELGVSGFGGLAILGYIKKEYVEKEKVVDESEFYEGLSIAQFVPGTTAGNLLSHIAYKMGKSKLMYLMLISFLLPAILSMLLLTYLDSRYGDLTFMVAISSGVKITVVVMLINTIIKITKPYFKRYNYLFNMILAFVMKLYSVNIIFIIILVVILNYFTDSAYYEVDKGEKDKIERAELYFPLLFIFSFLLLLFFNENKLVALYTSMVKIGFLCFGGGVAAIGLINDLAVEGKGWLNREEFLKGIALAQMTPGPVLNISVYIGYKLAGLKGSVLAAIGMFTPGVVLMHLFSLFYSRLFNSVVLKKIVTGILLAFNGIIIYVLLFLFREGVKDYRSFIFFCMILIIDLKFKLSPIYLIILSIVMAYIYFI